MYQKKDKSKFVNLEQPENIPHISTTFFASKEDKSKFVKLEQFKNIQLISVTFFVSKEDKSIFMMFQQPQKKPQQSWIIFFKNIVIWYIPAALAIK